MAYLVPKFTKCVYGAYFGSSERVCLKSAHVARDISHAARAATPSCKKLGRNFHYHQTENAMFDVRNEIERFDVGRALLRTLARHLLGRARVPILQAKNLKLNTMKPIFHLALALQAAILCGGIILTTWGGMDCVFPMLRR